MPNARFHSAEFRYLLDLREKLMAGDFPFPMDQEYASAVGYKRSNNSTYLSLQISPLNSSEICTPGEEPYEKFAAMLESV